MNSLLFQFIETKNLPWDVGKKDNTRPEKMTVEDPGILRLRKLIIGKQLPELYSLLPDWITSAQPVRGGEEWSSDGVKIMSVNACSGHISPVLY